jgi:hypothetical protein
MNAYILLPQKNVQINDVPPRLMWNNDQSEWSSPASGYCGETSILSAGLQLGQYVPMYLVRQLLADYFSNTEQLPNGKYFWKGNPLQPTNYMKQMWSTYFGIGWNENDPNGTGPGAAYKADKKKGKLSLYKWFLNHGQYYCQVVPQIGPVVSDPDGYDPINHVLNSLALKYEHYQVHLHEQDTRNKFVPWMKKHVMKGHPVVIGLQDFFGGSGDPDFDHIVTVFGWGSNKPLNQQKYFPDDEIVFSDHGLGVCGQQPHGGSIPYYFRYTMEVQKNIKTTGGWLMDGGCQDPDNPAFNFIQDLGSNRTIPYKKPNGKVVQKVCNTYQLAESLPYKTTQKTNSVGNAGFAIQGLKKGLTPAGVTVRIDTNYYQVPVITVAEATGGKQPPCEQVMNHCLTISGLNPKKKYDVWKFVAKNTSEIRAITSATVSQYPALGSICKKLSRFTNCDAAFAMKADEALFIRVVETK